MTGAEVGGAGGRSTSVPTAGADGGVAKPRSRSADAWATIVTGCCSPRISATTSRRLPRCAVATSVWRAASVNPDFAAIAPSYDGTKRSLLPSMKPGLSP